MKRLVLAIFLMLGAIIIGITSFFSLNSLSNEIISETKTCIEVSHNDNQEELIKATENLSILWQKSQEKIVILTSREDLKTVETNIPTLEILAKSGELDLYRLRCTECISAMESLKKKEKLTWGNIF